MCCILMYIPCVGSQYIEHSYVHVISSVGSQNLVTFVNVGVPNAWRIFCQILVALDQLEPP